MAQARPSLIVLPTGTGKTMTAQLVAEHARARSSKPILWLAHRTELIEQAVERLKSAGVWCFVEQAGRRPAVHQVVECGMQRPTAVVASVPTLRGDRMRRWRPDAFSLVLVDEAHHGVAATWQAAIGYFEAPCVGLTATPQRQGLGELFEVAYQMTLREALDEGWLVPIDGREIHPDGWDMSDFTKPRGAADISADELNGMVEEHMPAALQPLRDHLGGQSCLAFWPSVASARGCAEWLQAADIPACWVDGESSADERASAIGAFRGDRIQVLSNCAVLTEGFDAPNARMLAIARPTRSAVMYMQMLGRVLRPLPGVIDGLETAEERRASIEASGKPRALVLDYQGSGAKFDVMSLVELVGGSIPAKVKERARQMMQGASWGVDEVLARAAKDIEREQLEAEARERAAAEAARRRHEDLTDERAKRRAIVDRLTSGETKYTTTVATWCQLGATEADAKRYEARAELGGDILTEQQRRAIYALTVQLCGKQRASAVWRASEAWSRTAASKEIDYLRHLERARARKAAAHTGA